MLKKLLIMTLFIVFAHLHSAAEAETGNKYTLITILHTNDLHGRVMPEDHPGGLVRIATLVNQVRSEVPNPLLLDAGDIIHGTIEDYLAGHLATIQSMNAMRYDAAAAGNHEFDFGLDTLRNVLKTAEFPLLSANVVDARTGGQWESLAPFRIFELDGVRVGVFGLTTPGTVGLQWPASIQEVKFLDPIEVSAKLVPELRKQADVVVALSHLGLEPDKQLARTVSGIDFIIGGHTHTPVMEWLYVGDTLVTQTGAHGRGFGRIDFIVRKSGHDSEIVSVNGRNGNWNRLANPPLGLKYPDAPVQAVTAEIPVDESVEATYLPFREEARRYLAEVIGHSADTIPGGRGQVAAANLAADAIREKSGADFALVDAGSVVSGIYAGPLTRGHAYGMIGGYTRQQIIVGKASGQQFKEAYESILEGKSVQDYGISGFEVRLGDSGNVESLLVNGQQVEASREYTVAAQAYIMMALMDAHSGVTVFSEEPYTTREAIATFFESSSPVRRPEACFR